MTSLAVTGNVSAGNVSATDVSGTTLGGTLTTAAQPNVTSVGTLTSLAVTGNASAGNLSTGGALSVTGNANVGNIGGTNGVFTNVSGNGSALSAITGANVTGQVGNALVAGTVYTAAQPNITSVGTLSSLSVTGNIDAGNLTTTGVLSVTGNGTSSIAGNLDMTSNNIINLATPVAGTDAATKQYVDDLASTALVYHEGVTAATTDTLANTTSGTITYNNGSNGVGATLTTTGTFNLIDTANVQTLGTRILVKDEANAAHNGVYTYSNTTVITRATDADSYGPGAGELSLNNYFFVSGGSVNKGSAYVLDAPTGTITFGTSDIEFAQFSSSQVYLAGTGLTLTDLTFSVNASQTQITSVGTLTGLAVNGNITAANITANTGVFTGNGSGLSALAGGNVTGQVANALVAGTVYTAAQPNITSVGTLTSLSVSGNANVGNIGAAAGVFTSVSGNGSALTALNASNISTGTLAQARLANASVTLGSTALTLGSTVTTVAGLTSVTSTTFVGALTGAATTAGTVTTAAQPNITSLGTLTGLTLAANADITMSGTGSNINGVALVSATLFAGSGANLTNLNASNISSGTLAQARLANASVTLGSTALTLGSTVTTVAGLSSVTSTTFVGALTGAATTAGTVTTAAQPNITSVGTLTSLAVTGNVSAGNVTSTGTLGGSGATLLGNLLTTGSNSTAGVITGDWTLSSGSTLNATYADLAEKYVADADYEPGTVLVFGGAEEVTMSLNEDDHRVAGVVTTNPAYVMNQACAGEHVATVALTGRVPCKVVGPVNKGDLLVSSRDGRAVVNNNPKPGTIIGKAITQFVGTEVDEFGTPGYGVVEIAVGRF